jgi:hypothetical protein
VDATDRVDIDPSAGFRHVPVCRGRHTRRRPKLVQKGQRMDRQVKCELGHVN